MKWERVRVKLKANLVEGKKSPGRRGGTAGPGKKWGHTCNAVRNGRFIYVFGGYGKDDCQTNDVHVFDTAKETWSKPMVKGNPPQPRDSHSCTTVGSKLFVFGGTDGNRPLADLHVLDTATNTWSKPTVNGEGPAAREGHSAALVGQDLYVFGGCGKAKENLEDIYFNDLYVLNTETFFWAKLVTLGTPPARRDSHTCSSFKNKFIVLGGEDGSNSYLSDVHILDVDTRVWKELKTSGSKLMPRAGHTTVSQGKHLIVFGGFTDDRKLFDDLHVLNVVTGIWTKATATGAGPSPRFSLAGDCFDPEKGLLLFYGGCNDRLEALDDMYYLDTELRLERDSGDYKPEKLSMRKELKRRRQEHRPIDNLEKEMAFETFEKPLLSPALAGLHRPLYEAKPVAEKIFEAKINDVFHYGYTLEASIEGKPFRGLLFSYKPGFAHAVHSYLTRKRTGADAIAGRMREVRKESLKIARVKQNIKRPEAAQYPSTTYISNLHDGHAALSSVDQLDQYQHQIMHMNSPTSAPNPSIFVAPDSEKGTPIPSEI
ncbi:hypothetical protein O6H91_09G097200 [Diphasiastrum complanatum]|uniref:Uncharacterized protein n=2 Tax=Diphasiastrum complanatum TaxID=34168 RepID=A0ACC2CSC4_DIPCM|nr:hypothetical protein O6H91_09G097200 [Diphasiastrum complanatum]KAJ7544881.1 hypothetical protein O6H91_09G097200 [Diphasiastrum complanatum]